MKTELFKFDWLPNIFVKCFIAEAKTTKIKDIKIYTN